MLSLRDLIAPITSNIKVRVEVGDPIRDYNNVVTRCITSIDVWNATG